eukprot:TRINITY_DN3966_c0_g1_i1.p1 TRINITY_DN3966_c0_g1~~TRINITY_DN3966_c0_g1_i1.p1  ORF type:complete len:354 (+),score=65.46 TRINITY_DN3966_c0_g1_i1:46-1062(+)
MTAIAMILSEKLNIPMIGFIFQPTCLPSERYPAVVPLSKSIIDETIISHKTQKAIKGIMDNNIFEDNIPNIRARRGLPPHSKNTWIHIVKTNMPLIIPIQEYAFGGKPSDWHENARLTNFIFLRKGPLSDLSPKFENFLNEAKKNDHPIIAIGFSSMPIPRTTILDIVMLLIERCTRKPAVIALVGNRDSKEKVSPQLEEKANILKEKGLLLEEKGAPFGRLFPRLDCIIIHGGLGTTAEALRVGVPVIVTGVLLMDQRFWGRRVFELGVGPEPVHISNFPSVCVELVDKALEKNGSWAVKADEIKTKFIGESDDGVEENLRAFMEFTKLNAISTSHK